jgi:hypothetical protein
MDSCSSFYSLRECVSGLSAKSLGQRARRTFRFFRV